MIFDYVYMCSGRHFRKKITITKGCEIFKYEEYILINHLVWKKIPLLYSNALTSRNGFEKRGQNKGQSEILFRGHSTLRELLGETFKQNLIKL